MDSIIEPPFRVEERLRALGPEMRTSLTLFELARWLLTPAGADIHRCQTVALIPVVNPDSWEDMRFRNVNDVNLYADFTLDGKPTQPESQAVWRVQTQLQPELFCSLHGTHYGWRYRMAEGSGFSYTTSQYDRTHSRLFVEEIVRAAEAAGFPQDRGEEDAERIVPWLPEHAYHSYYSRLGITSCVNAYHRYHTLGNTLEIHYPLSGLVRCIKMLTLGSQSWRYEATPGYPVRTVFWENGTLVAAYGQTAAERRASRIELWQHSNQLVLGVGYHAPVGFALIVFSLDPADHERWHHKEIGPFLDDFSAEEGIDLSEIRAACRSYPDLQEVSCDQMEPVDHPRGLPLLRTATQGLALRTRLPGQANVQRVLLDGQPIATSPRDGYQSWSTQNEFTMLQVNIPPRPESERYQRHIALAEYEAPRVDLERTVEII